MWRSGMTLWKFDSYFCQKKPILLTEKPASKLNFFLTGCLIFLSSMGRKIQMLTIFHLHFHILRTSAKLFTLEKFNKVLMQSYHCLSCFSYFELAFLSKKQTWIVGIWCFECQLCHVFQYYFFIFKYFFMLSVIMKMLKKKGIWFGMIQHTCGI